MTKPKPLEVSGLIHQVTRRTGIDPIDIQMVSLIAPDHVLVSRYLRNEQGEKHLDENGEIAIEVIEIKARFRG